MNPYIQLCKPGIVRMVGVTAAFSFILASPGGTWASLFRLLSALIGIMASAAGSAALNNVIEKDLDSRMDRTRNRALPTGLIKSDHALALGICLTLGGTVWLMLTVNLLTAFLVLATAFLYVLIYTPLKTRTWLNTTIGAVPGAMPTLCGWAAAVDHLDFGAWVMFAILFAWQHPHFYAIAWLYRDDYQKAGYQMLSVIDKKGTRLFVQVILFSLMLAAVSLVPAFADMAGPVYFAGAFLLALYLLWAAYGFIRRHTAQDARKLLMTTIIYLPALFVVILADLGFELYLRG